MDIVKILKPIEYKYDEYEPGELIVPDNRIWDFPRDSWGLANAEDLAKFILEQDSYDDTWEEIAVAFCEMADIDFNDDKYEDPWTPLEEAAEKLGLEIF